jgi:hypothetical protein
MGIMLLTLTGYSSTNVASGVITKHPNRSDLGKSPTLSGFAALIQNYHYGKSRVADQE